MNNPITLTFTEAELVDICRAGLLGQSLPNPLFQRLFNLLVERKLNPLIAAEDPGVLLADRTAQLLQVIALHAKPEQVERQAVAARAALDAWRAMADHEIDREPGDVFDDAVGDVDLSQARTAACG